jgi:hypothetical protein
MQVRKRVAVTAGEKGQKTAYDTSPLDGAKITYEIIEHENIKNRKVIPHQLSLLLSTG